MCACARVNLAKMCATPSACSLCLPCLHIHLPAGRYWSTRLAEEGEPSTNDCCEVQQCARTSSSGRNAASTRRASRLNAFMAANCCSLHACVEQWEGGLSTRPQCATTAWWRGGLQSIDGRRLLPRVGGQLEHLSTHNHAAGDAALSLLGPQIGLHHDRDYVTLASLRSRPAHSIHCPP